MNLKKKIITNIIFCCATITLIAAISLPALSAETKATANTEVTENIVGHNNAGPYTLTWKDFDEKTFEIIVSGKTLKKSKEYKLSVSDGSLSFNSVLVTDAIAKFRYTLIAGKSTKTTTVSSTPLSLSLLNKGNTSLNLSGLYAQDAKGATTAIVGVGGEKKWGTSSFTSAFNISQGTDGDNTSAMDRSSMSLGTTTNIGSLKITGNYTNVGNSFAGASNYGLTLGQKVTDLSMAFAPNNSKLQATSTYKETEYTTGDKKGFYSLENKQEATLAATASTKLSFNRSETANQEKTGTVRTSEDKTVMGLEQALGKFGNATMSMTDSVTVDKNKNTTQLQSKDYNLNSALGKFGSATMSMTDRQTTVNGVLTDLQQKNYSLNAALSQNMKATMTMQDQQKTVDGVLYDYQSKVLGMTGTLAGSALSLTSSDVYRSDAGIINNIRTNTLGLSRALSNTMAFTSTITRQNSDLRGDDNLMAFGLTTKIRENLGVTLQRSMAESDIDGDTTANTLKLDNMKFSKMALTGSFTDSNNTLTGNTTTSVMDMTTNPIKNMSFSTKYTSTDSEVDGLTDTTAMTLAVTPGKNMEISGTISDKTAKDIPTLSRTLNLKTTPAKYTTITALVGQSGTAGVNTNKHGAALALTPREKLSLSAGFTEEVTGSSTLTISDYTTTFGIWKMMNITGSYRDRELTTGNAYDTTAMNLTLNPFKFLAFTGAYTLNPENNKGVIQNYEANTLGMTAKIGSLSLTGAYTSKDQYLANSFVDETKLSMAMPVFGSGSLETGFKMAKNFATNDDLSKEYSLSYKQKLSENFSLSLGGKYTKYIQNQMYMPDRDNIEADVSLELKF